MNHYKIDWNRYSTEAYPYALYARRRRWWRWEHIQSFRTKEEAIVLYNKLEGLPLYLN